MTGLLFSIEKRLYFFEMVACALCIIVILFTVALSVCIRTFNWPLPNVAELALVAMSPLAFVGSAMCARMGAHISVDIIEQLPFRGIKRAAEFLVAFLMLVFSVSYAWFAFSLFQDTLLSGEQWLDMGTPLYAPTFFYVAGMVCMAFHCICTIFRCFGYEDSAPDAIRSAAA